MNYKTFILIFLLTFIQKSHGLELLDYIKPIFPFFVAALSYLRVITDYFIPATHADLKQVKEELLSEITLTTQEMQNTTYKNVDHIFTTNKEELEKKINESIEVGSHTLQFLLKQLETAKQDSSKQIKRNHQNFSKALKKKIEHHSQMNKQEIDTFLYEVSEYNAQMLQKLLIHLLSVQEQLKKIYIPIPRFLRLF